MPEYRIERRDLHSGALVGEFGAGGIITESPSGVDGIPYEITLDSGGLYICGYDAGGTAGAPQWRIEKRDLSTGALALGFGAGGAVTEYISAATAGGDLATSLAVNSTALYVTGVTGLGGDLSWRVEKRSALTGELVSDFGSSGAVSEVPGISGGTPTSIVLDSTGLYVGGYVGQLLLVAGFTVNNENEFSIKSADPIFSIKDVSDSPGDFYWQVEKRDLSSGALSSNFGGSGIYTYNPTVNDSNLDEIFNLAIDDNGLYVFGMSNPTRGNYSWLVQDFQFPDAAAVTATLVSTSTPAPAVLPETGAGAGSSGQIPFCIVGFSALALIGYSLFRGSRACV